jgi:general secretion pathway protein M
MNALLEAWRQRWETWTQRERRMVVAMLAALGLALAYLVLLDPALSGGAKLARDLPKLRADAAEMAGIAAGAARLPHPVAGRSLRSTLEASLLAAGLKADISARDNGAVVLKFEKASYNTLAAWAFNAVREAAAQIETATVTSVGEGGRVNAEFVFKR